MNEYHAEFRGRGIAELDLSNFSAADKEKLATLQSLDLAHNEIPSIIDLYAFSGLTSLNVSHNKLTTLSGLPPSLVDLDVEFNQLSSLDSMLHLPLIERLNAGNNALVTLSGIPRCATLRHLNVSYNRLPNLAGVENLPNLTNLEAGFNYACMMDDFQSLAMLSNLKKLVLRGNSLTPDLVNLKESLLALVPSLTHLDDEPITVGSNSPDKLIFGGSHVLSPPQPEEHPHRAQHQQHGAASPINTITPPTHPPTNFNTARTSTSTPTPTGSSLVAIDGHHGSGGGVMESPHSNSRVSSSGSPPRGIITSGGGSGGGWDGEMDLSSEEFLGRDLNSSIFTDGPGYSLSSRHTELAESTHRLELDVEELTKLLAQQRRHTAQAQRAQLAAETEAHSLKVELGQVLQTIQHLTKQQTELKNTLQYTQSLADHELVSWKGLYQNIKEERVERADHIGGIRLQQTTTMRALQERNKDLDRCLTDVGDNNIGIYEENEKLRAYANFLQDKNQHIQKQLMPVHSSQQHPSLSAPQSPSESNNTTPFTTNPLLMHKDPPVPPNTHLNLQKLLNSSVMSNGLGGLATGGGGIMTPHNTTQQATTTGPGGGSPLSHRVPQQAPTTSTNQLTPRFSDTLGGGGDNSTISSSGAASHNKMIHLLQQRYSATANSPSRLHAEVATLSTTQYTQQPQQQQQVPMPSSFVSSIHNNISALALLEAHNNNNNNPTPSSVNSTISDFNRESRMSELSLEECIAYSRQANAAASSPPRHTQNPFRIVHPGEGPLFSVQRKEEPKTEMWYL